jgi:hypothetical protein
MADRMRAILGGPLARITEFPVSHQFLAKMGQCMVDALSEEAKEYFAKRGWSGKDPMGGPPIWESFSFRIRGKNTLEFTSSFYGMQELAQGSIPERKMFWLTQEAKDRNPGDYDLTPKEKDLGMKKTGRVSQGERLPLIVPLMTEGGNIEFRRAPLNLGDAWVHPGIAKFTFFETAVRKWRVRCARLLKEEFVKAMNGGKK